MPDPSSSNELAAGLTFGFALALVAGLLLRFWLASRQIRHVARHRGELPADFANTVSLSAHQKAADYTIAKTRLGLLELALGAGVLLGWTLLGGISTLNSVLLSALGGGGMVQQLAVLASFAVISALLDLPLGLYQTFSVEQAYGFNKTTPKLWLLDFVKSSLLGALIGLPIAALILWLMGAAGAQWWIWAWGTWVGFNLLLMWALPTFIAPLFNKFTALEDGTIKTQVTALMARCGFAAKGLFVMDGSKRSAHGNAYFTGFGSAKRVVFYDTLLAKLSPDEIAAVLAHELGHFKHRHLSRRMLLLFATSLLAFAMLGWLANQSWFYAGLGVAPNLGAPNDALALLLFMISAPLLSFFIAPVFSAMSRRDEFQADAYAVAHTSGQDLATALLKLYEDNAATLTPDPVYVRFYYSHPPASERLARLLGP
ncbi:MAG: M48 family metallopeptidase [Burkholderiales bacterium]|nr:M48 family metallopeptidase [Burkholderiales bacterium]